MRALHQKNLRLMQQISCRPYPSIYRHFPRLTKSLVPFSYTFLLVVLISDNGIGIEEKNIQNIFSKFRQLDTKNAIPKKQKGTGLGLVIAKGIIEEHKGKIGVISKIGNGSTFFFTLPLV